MPKKHRKYRKLNTPEMTASIDRMLAEGHRALHIAQELRVDPKMVGERANRKGYLLAYVKKAEHVALILARQNMVGWPKALVKEPEPPGAAIPQSRGPSK